jgi:ribosome biogenesis GTPase
MVASTKASINDAAIRDDSDQGSNSDGITDDATTLAATLATTLASEDLKTLGWQPHFAKQLEERECDHLEYKDLIPVRITEVRSKSIHVVGAGGMDHLIPITQGQKIINDNDEKVVVAGDWILVENTASETNDGNQIALQPPPTLKIKKILCRRSVIKRKAPGRNTRKKQLIASNLDTVFVVSSCNQDFNVARLERYIAMVLETENVAPVIVLTKKDLLEMEINGDDIENEIDGEASMDIDMDIDLDIDMEKDDEEDYGFEGEQLDASSSWLLDYYLDEAGSIASGSIPVVCLDARNGDEAWVLLEPWLGEGQTVAFVGSSGVGKSTLVNSLCGVDLVKVGDIHTDSGQGRHTTTRRQLHFLNQNNNNSNDNSNGIRISSNDTCGRSCAILDTPGLRELQLVDAAQGLDEVFKDLVELSRSCRFNDCKHSGEPGCAIEAAVESGDIDVDRLARWEKLVAEDAANTKDVEESRIERERKKNRKAKTKSKQSKPSSRNSPEGRDIRMQGRKTKR